MGQSTEQAVGGGESPPPYEPSEIEAKWQDRWEADRLYVTPDEDPEGRERWYQLTMFPYTSGDLHIGHWYAIAPSDTAARYQRMLGKNVLFPIGFDAFGLPAENAAIRDGTHPLTWTYANVETMRGQLQRMGASFDWTREVVTSDPEYYRWTQWWFLQLLKHDLAYRKMAPANWCPSCQTVLANEQVLRGDDEVGRCERCESVVETRDLEQWFFRITKYADELLDFGAIDWPSRIKAMQTNWIGRSEGAEIRFPLDGKAGGSEAIPVFTTRADTLFGVTYLVLAPEHALVAALTTPEQRGAVEGYVAATPAGVGDRAAVDDAGEDGGVHGGVGAAPADGGGGAGVGGGLCAGVVRDGGGDGGAGARHAGLRVCDEVRAADPGGDRAAGLGGAVAGGGVRGGGADGELGGVRRAERGGGEGGGGGEAGGGGVGRGSR